MCCKSTFAFFEVELLYISIFDIVDVCFSTILVLCNCSGSWRVLSAEKFRMLTPQPLVGLEKHLETICDLMFSERFC